MRWTHALTLLAFTAAPFGCGEKGVDSHREVFKTADEVGADRRAKLLDAHKQLAVSVLKFARPDLTAKPGEGGAIDVSADGLTQSIDLLPVEEQMATNSNKERTVLRAYLLTQLRAFDDRRVRELGLEKIKPALRFDLVNDKGLSDLQTAAGASKVHSVKITSGLYRVTAVHRPGAVVTVTDALVGTWHTTTEAVDAAATDQMKALLADAGEKAFDTTAYSTVGRTGSLRVDAGVIALPEFLDAVHKYWRTGDDLVLCMPSPRGVQFMESQNTRLAEIVMPQWRQLIATTPDALFPMMLLRTRDKLSAYLPPAPATAPAPPPATKPETYIVH